MICDLCGREESAHFNLRPDHRYRPLVWYQLESSAGVAQGLPGDTQMRIDELLRPTPMSEMAGIGWPEGRRRRNYFKGRDRALSQ
jgi:hypothetical protein